MGDEEETFMFADVKVGIGTLVITGKFAGGCIAGSDSRIRIQNSLLYTISIPVQTNTFSYTNEVYEYVRSKIYVCVRIFQLLPCLDGFCGSIKYMTKDIARSRCQESLSVSFIYLM